MTFEQLLLIGLLIGIPLIQRLIRALQTGTGETQADGQAGDPVREGPPPRPRRPLHDRAEEAEGDTLRADPPADRAAAPSTLPRPASRPRGRERHLSRDDARPRRESRPASPAGLAPQLARQSTGLRATGGVADLRRGIVLMAILGPCRALQPDDASHRPW